MRTTLLPDAKDLYATENASLSGASAAGDRAAALLRHAGDRPRRSATCCSGRRAGCAGAPTGCSTSAWSRRASSSSSRWPGSPPPTSAPGATCCDAQARGSATVEAVAQVGIAVQEAHADESLTLIDNTGDDAYQVGLPDAGAASSGQDRARCSPPRRRPPRAPRPRRRWPRRSATRGPGSPRTPGPVARRQREPPRGRRVGPRHAAGRRGRVVRAAVGRPHLGDQRATRPYSTRPRAPRRAAYTALEAGLIVAALLMAAACAWGLSRRLAEYR